MLRFAAATLLTVPQPCAESWARMTPASGGRHCAACAKTVVDFTHKTDAEILTHLKHASAAGCGRFRAHQLARPLLPAAPVSRWRSWLASVLALGGVLGSGRAAAQAGGNYFSGGLSPTVASPAGTGTSAGAVPVPPAAPGPTAVPVAPGGPLILRGVVLDAPTGDPLPGVTVLLKDTSQGVSTNAKGEFVLELPATAATSILVFSFVGYSRQELPVASAAGAAPATIRLAADTHVLGEVVVAGGYFMRKPWPWHPRALYYRAKSLATRPFRR